MSDSKLPALPLEYVIAQELDEIRAVRKLRDERAPRPEPAPPATPAAPPDAPPENAGVENRKNGPATDTTPKGGDAPRSWSAVVESAHDAKLAALCFSGGGIRSATFNLGVLQALAEMKLLTRFDYLSTVSGGGYIGAWLEAWTFRHSIRDVQAALGENRSTQPDTKEPPPIRFLRVFSNYLTPKTGMFSADFWAMIAIYLRNTFLNQIILFSTIAAVLLIPHLVNDAVSSFYLPSSSTGIALALGAIMLLLACTVSIINMVLLDRGTRKQRLGLTKPAFIYAAVCAPLFVTAAILAVMGRIFPSAALTPKIFQCLDTYGPAARMAAWGGALYAAVWLPTTLFGKIGEWWLNQKSKPAAAAFSWKFFDAAVGLVSAALAGVVAGYLYATICNETSRSSEYIWIFRVPLILGALLLALALQVGVMGISFKDRRREWWARAGGMLLISGLAWMVVWWMALDFSAFVKGPTLHRVARIFIAAKILTPAWIVTTAASVLSAKSSATGKPGSTSWLDLVAKIGPYVFIAGLLAWVSWIVEALIASSAPNWIYNNGIPYELVLFLAFAAVAALMSLRIDVNQFSMHMFYRNRLVRCYLGASVEDRKPNLFTGFASNDDLSLKQFRSKSGYDGLYPVFNASLNLVKGKDLAWQERKAESFIFSPLFCGYDVWLEEQDAPVDVKDRTDADKTAAAIVTAMKAPKPQNLAAAKAMDAANAPKLAADRVQNFGLDRFGYRPTDQYAFPAPLDGPHVGLAMGISGAAASPNMGYHSSAPVAFLMTVFDVRLGQWLGNTRDPRTWAVPTPACAFLPLMNELLAGSDDESAWIYLSDGGHFENLGVYEMVKRRCKLIVVGDADCDDDYAFGDLGNAIQKCREDMGIDITLDVTPIVPKKPGGPCGVHCVVGQIHYENVDPGADAGTIVYVKASLTGDEPTDVASFAKAYPEFPHQTTADQWFTESQFESYRELGYHSVISSFQRRPVPAHETEREARVRKNTEAIIDAFESCNMPDADGTQGTAEPPTSFKDLLRRVCSLFACATDQRRPVAPAQGGRPTVL